jgi:hypothetical protein
MEIVRTVYKIECLQGKEWVRLWTCATRKRTLDVKKEYEDQYPSEKFRVVKETTTTTDVVIE